MTTRPRAPDASAASEAHDGGGEWLRTWRSVEELADPDAPGDATRAEFARAFSLPEASRRDALRIMAASLAFGASGCGDASSPPGEAVPYVTQPEQQVPGHPRFYATATLFEGFAQPVLVAAHEARPTKIEGNPDHPIGNGGTDAFMQAAVLQFYDPDRSQTVQRQGRISTWGTFERELLGLRQSWDANGGSSLRLLTGAVTSPTLNRQLDRLVARWPNARRHCFEPVGSGLREEATRLAFGEPLSLHYALERAEVVVALDDDLLGAGPQQVRNAGGWAARRRTALQGDGACRLHVAEPTPTLTGAMAQTRLPIEARRIAALASALAQRPGVATTGDAELSAGESGWIEGAAADLRPHAGRCLVAVGPFQPPEVQALAFRINHALGNIGRTVMFTDPVASAAEDDLSLSALAADMAAGAVQTLMVLDANPAYTSFADIDFGRRLERVPLRLHAGLFYDETAERSHWHLPLSHSLESWSDARAVDGTVTVLQPVTRPLYDTRSIHELIALLLAEPPYEARAIVAQTWQSMLAGEPGDSTPVEERWRNILRSGFIQGSALAPHTFTPRTAPLPVPAMPDESERAGLEIVFRPDPSIWDGRFANCAWLQELPRPLTKLTWDNIAALSPSLAARLGVRSGELVEIVAAGNRLVAPAWVLPGQAERSITVFLGYGRRRAGRVGDNLGYDAYALRRADAPWALGGAQLRKLGKRAELATTQTHGTTEGHDIVRLVAMRQAPGDKNSAGQSAQPSLYPPRPPDEHAWAMAIDLDLCIGCNACVIACQAENNVPSVGKRQVALGRAMHWLRVDRYYAGPTDNPETYFMPVPCMHCEKAPCELGCPVNATVHGNGGLNEMVYNRCIGTRTCSSYCPYKVRRFNWFDYTRDATPSIQAQRNPNVTVRDRGVMEKCTFCIQRIAKAKIDADVENRSIRDGEVVPACQAACPTTAIMFGDLRDPNSRVSRWKQTPRNYALLAHLGTRPRTTYLARVAGDKGEV
jgi:molybdopterin-containing oxidoreductase family iron-sulfur binding subunit